MCNMERPSLSRLNDLFHCDSEKGSLRWKISGRGICAGDEAGSARNKGRYRYVKVDGRYYTVANIIWFVHYGSWPSSRLSPLNKKPSDCSISNLVEQRSLRKFDHSTKEGRSAYLKEHRKTYPDYHRDKDLRKTFGISLADYDKMLSDQNGVCAICGMKETTTRNGKLLSLAVDHDHSTDKIRGLLCIACNTGIGKMGDSPSLMRAAADYLEVHGKSMPTSMYDASAALGFGA